MASNAWVKTLLSNQTVAASGGTATATIGPAKRADIIIDLTVAGTSGDVVLQVQASADGSDWHPVPVRDPSTAGGDYVLSKSLTADTDQLLLAFEGAAVYPYLRLSVTNNRDADVTISAWAVVG